MRQKGPRYGVDGYPYFVGLGVGTLVLSVVGVRLGRSERRALRPVGVASAVGAVAAAVPLLAGTYYVSLGKLRLRDRILGLVPWRGDDVVLDLGAGRGLLGVGAAGRTSGVVHCVDLFIGKDLFDNSPELLHENAVRAGVEERIDIRREDVRAMSLADHSVDVVLSTLCLHNIGSASGRAEALAEIVRVLRPGGTVVISDLAHVDDEYAPALRRAGLRVDLLGGVGGTFPPQRLLLARSDVSV